MAPRMVRSMWPLGEMGGGGEEGGREGRGEERGGGKRGEGGREGRDDKINVGHVQEEHDGVTGVPSLSELLVVNKGLCVSGKLKTQNLISLTL